MRTFLTWPVVVALAAVLAAPAVWAAEAPPAAPAAPAAKPLSDEEAKALREQLSLIHI